MPCLETVLQSLMHSRVLVPVTGHVSKLCGPSMGLSSRFLSLAGFKLVADNSHWRIAMCLTHGNTELYRIVPVPIAYANTPAPPRE